MSLNIPVAGINSGRKGARSWLVRAVAKVNVEVASRYYLRFVARGGKSEDYLAPRKWFAKVFTRWWREVETKRARYTSGIVFIPWCRFFLFLFPSSSSHRFSPARGFLPSREFDTNSIQDARSLSKENLFHSLINNVLNFSFQGLLTLSLLRFCARCRVLYDMIAIIVLVEYRFLEMYSIDIFNYRQSNLDCSETIFLEHRARFSCGRERKG